MKDEIKEYHKIENIYERNLETKKLDETKFRNEVFGFLKNVEWEFTEKIDGTNIRIYWDGHKVNFYGRTDKSQIPQHLVNRLIELFGGDENEELFEQKFGEMPVMLIGEGYGAKIQNSGLYRDDVDFILFDVLIAGNYQPRSVVEEFGKYFNIDVVPIVCSGTLESGVGYIKSHPKSTIGKASMEGIVGRPKEELRDRCGHRVIVKIKACDFE